MNRIISIASLTGRVKITNEELASRVGISSPERILEKTGIQNRFHCGDGENLFTLLTTSLILALNRVSLGTNRIDGIFVGANPTGPFLMPNPASVVASLAGIPPFHYGGSFTGCAGGLSALQAARDKLDADNHRSKPKQLYAVIAGDHTSTMMAEDSKDNTLFTDGASCILVTNRNDLYPEQTSIDIVDMNSMTDSWNSDAMACPHTGRMIHDPRRIFSFASTVMPTIRRMLGISYLPPASIFIPHQANLNIIKKLSAGLNCEIHDWTIQNRGNASPASVSMGLDYEWSKGFGSEREIYLAAFGEGLTVTVAKLIGRGCLPEMTEERIEKTREEVIQLYHESCWSRLKS